MCSNAQSVSHAWAYYGRKHAMRRLYRRTAQYKAIPAKSRRPKINFITCIVYDDDGAQLTLHGTGYAVRCAAAIADHNWPDARWALEVLTKYGHLVRHAADYL